MVKPPDGHTYLGWVELGPDSIALLEAVLEQLKIANDIYDLTTESDRLLVTEDGEQLTT